MSEPRVVDQDWLDRLTATLMTAKALLGGAIDESKKCDLPYLTECCEQAYAVLAEFIDDNDNLTPPKPFDPNPNNDVDF